MFTSLRFASSLSDLTRSIFSGFRVICYWSL